MFDHRFFSHTLIFFLFFCAFVFTPHTASAQFDFINPSTGEATKITVSPQHPKAFENVTVSVEDFSRDINTVRISWTLNGKAVAQGTGLKTYSFTTGALGSVSNVGISVGGTSHTVSIRPADIDLLWQAGSYVPPFYQGKALHTNQDVVKIVAEPFFLSSQGTRLDPATLIYNWKQNGKVMQSASGYGRQTFTVTPSILAKPIDIDVTVTSQTGDYAAQARTTIEESTPELVVYENSPLFGLQSQAALNSKIFSLGDKDETSLVAVPFFFSTSQSGVRDVVYSWSQNSNPITKKDNTIVFRAPANTTGTAAIAVRARHTTNFMQESNASFSIQFDKTEATTNGL